MQLKCTILNYYFIHPTQFKQTAYILSKMLIKSNKIFCGTNKNYIINIYKIARIACEICRLHSIKLNSGN